MFWEIFVRLCNEKGTKPNPVAKELGIASGTLTWWKNGRIPSSSTLHKIADYFGVSVEFLLGKEDTKKENPSAEEEFKVALFGGKENVSEEKWEQIMQYAKFLIEQK